MKKTKYYLPTAVLSIFLSLSLSIVADPMDAPNMHAIGSPDSDGIYTVSWDPVAGVNGYEVWEYDENGIRVSIIKTWNGNDTSIQRAHLENRTWSYKVRTFTYDGSTWTFSPNWSVQVPVTINRAVPAPADAVGHWPLDDRPVYENYSGSVQDTTGNGNAGNLSGSLRWEPGQIGGSIKFVRIDDDIAIPNNPELQNVQESNFTMAAWFKPASVPPNSGSQGAYSILSKEGHHLSMQYTRYQQFELEFWLNDGPDPDNNPDWSSLGSGGTYAPNQFYHVACVVDYDAAQMKMYVNGVFVNSRAFAAHQGVREYGTLPWRIGAARDDQSASYGFPADGHIDDVRIYSRPLASNEIAALAMLAPANPPSNAIPTALASATPLSGNTPLNVTFTGTGSSDSDGSIVSYSWDFGDGGTSSSANPSHTYNSAGSYVATLTVTDDGGAMDSDQVSITVNSAPQNNPPGAIAYANPTSGLVPLNVSFIGTLSQDSDGSIVGYSWDFGDGTSSTLANPPHTYTTPGVYVAELIVTDNDGATDTNTVTISAAGVPQNIPPGAVVQANPTSGNAPLSVSFIGTLSQDVDGSIVAYDWDFGDGNTSTSPNPPHTYTSEGSYHAVLTVTDNDGATDTNSVTINVGPAGPGPSYVNFNNEVFYSYGGSSQDKTPGNNAIEDGGATLHIWGNTWKAISLPYTITPDTLIEFEFKSTVQGEIHGVGLDENLGLSASRIFKVHGTQNWGIRTHDNYSGNDWKTYQTRVSDSYSGSMSYLVFANDHDNGTSGHSYYRNVRVIEDGGSPPNQAPTALASATPLTGDAPLNVAFTGSGSSDSDGTIASYSWNFGDGGSSTSADPSHTYNSAGTYLATLTVTDDDGDQGSNAVSITVNTPAPSNTPPTAVAAATPISGEAPLLVTFDGTGSTDDDGIVSHIWNFGDGTPNATGVVVQHTYVDFGSYGASLTVRDAQDEFDYDIQIITVDPATTGGVPYINFNSHPLGSYGGQDLTPGNVEVLDGGATLHMWGNTWKYMALPYTITPDTVIEFDFMSTSQGEIHGIGLEENLSLNAGRIFKVHGTQNWGIRTHDNYSGSGWQSYSINVSASYSGTKSYLVFVMDHDAGATGHSYFRNVRVHDGTPPPANQAPTALASATPLVGDAPLNVSFTGSGSTDPDGSVASYSWTFGDGGSSTLADPSHTYTTAGNYLATLVVTDNAGDADSNQVTITVNDAQVPIIVQDIENHSEHVVCAELDNIDIPMRGDAVEGFRIEATHPMYLPVPTNAVNPVWDNCVLAEPQQWTIGIGLPNSSFRQGGFSNGDVYYVEDNPPAGIDEPTSLFPRELNEASMREQEFRFTSEVPLGGDFSLRFESVSGTLEIALEYWKNGQWNSVGTRVFTGGTLLREWKTPNELPDFAWTLGTDEARLRLRVVTAAEGGLTTSNAQGLYDWIQLWKRATEEIELVKSAHGIMDVEPVRIDGWWRESSMNVSVEGGLSWTNVHYIRIHQRIADVASYPEVFVLYEDGNARITPHPESGTVGVRPGSSIILGPSADASRPFAGISHIHVYPLDMSMAVTYEDGSSANIELWVDRSRHVVDVTGISYDPLVEAPVRLRSMNVVDGMSDADRIENESGIFPIIDNWSMLSGTWFRFYREAPSYHNTRSPDFKIEVLDSAVAFLSIEAENASTGSNFTVVGRPGGEASGDAVAKLPAGEVSYTVTLGQDRNDVLLRLRYATDWAFNNSGNEYIEVLVDGQSKDALTYWRMRTSGTDDFEYLPDLDLGHLTAGTHTIVIRNISGLGQLDLDRLDLVSQPVPSMSIQVLATAEGESFNPASSSGAQVKSRTGASGSQTAAISAGGYALYNVNLASAGPVYVRVTYSEPHETNILDVNVDGALSAMYPTQDTGSYTSFHDTQDIYLGMLTAGSHSVELSNYEGNADVEIDLIEFVTY